ncbi:DUF3313 domain-containing protein [Ancylobacter sp. WKF20]|uniref:DUF3313 domain-containing protein n=1 Tax=Ancylobacter sp. WKF20 TaxID=3039801 RepID=UPI00243422C0|nr:DUF3313 domain-containing protein [Ancylobacter sp. WKF20]WGD30880.1 DUF3313 domain-containing protein [Ancylobacter sp. WKF20]
MDGVRAMRVLGLMAGLAVGGCANAPLEQGGTLSSYADLKPSNGVLTQAALRANKEQVLAARTVRIVPTRFTPAALEVPFTDKQRALVANAVDRALCAGLSERFEVVAADQPADLTVRASVTHITRTDATMVAVSKGLGIAKSVVLPDVIAPTPRLPIGLGSLSMEAGAYGPSGDQVVAMTWARGASALVGASRAAEEGDAYVLAAEFGADFSRLVATGDTPFGKMPDLPSAEKIGAALKGTPKHPACAAFGRTPGFADMVGDGLGLPPDWTDKGAAPAP